MRQVIITAWAVSIVVQAVLLWLLVRRGHFRHLPLFTAWIGFDLVRWSAIFAVYIDAYRTNRYAVIFAWTEPLDMLLLAGAGIEAAGSAAFGWGMAIALAGGALIRFPETDLPLRTQFLCRALIAGAVASATVIRSTVAPSWHRSILIAFCAIDLTTYLSLVMYSSLDRLMIQSFVMVGQCLCLAAWAVRFARGSR